jgi:hypothetical protein
MSRFTIHRCHICGKNEFADNMIEYNDHWFCGLPHKLIQERKENADLNRLNIDRVQLRALGRSSEQ